MSAPVARELTAPAAGAIAVVSVTGPGARDLVAGLVDGGRVPGPGGLALARLVAGEELLDEALLAVPSEVEVEIGLHGAPAVVRRVLGRLRELGARSGVPAADRAERALEALASAPSEAAARILLDQAEGALERGLREVARAPLERAREAVELMLRRAAWLERARRPALVVLAGPVNAGKSTLFNVLVGRERAVVAAEPGTTRDLVRARTRLGAWPVELVDGAGERPLGQNGGQAGAVEARGQALARGARREADLVLWLDPGGGSAPPGALLIRSRADPAQLGRGTGPPALAALERPEAAVETATELFRSALGLPADPWHPGAPVPFDPADRDALRQGLGRGDPRPVARRLASEARLD